MLCKYSAFNLRLRNVRNKWCKQIYWKPFKQSCFNLRIINTITISNKLCKKQSHITYCINLSSHLLAVCIPPNFLTKNHLNTEYVQLVPKPYIQLKRSSRAYLDHNRHIKMYILHKITNRCVAVMSTPLAPVETSSSLWSRHSIGRNKKKRIFKQDYHKMPQPNTS